jgi:polyhydroxyalkanoate synthase
MGFRQISPRPLGLHLATAMAGLTGAAAAAPLAASGGVPWHPSIAESGDALGEALKQADPDSFTREVWSLVTAGMGGMVDGIRLYQAHPVHRTSALSDSCWRQGAAGMTDFGGTGQPAVLVPSLVNRSHVLDLDEGASLCRWLAAQGVVRPFLLDWGAPGEVERAFGLAGYVNGPLRAALTHVRDIAGAPIPLLGYCMGGNIALAAAQAWPEDVSALALLATPWDFHADISAPAKLFAESMPSWRPVLDAYGEMPVDLLQSFFAALDPGLAQRKFARFATMDMDGPEARKFVLLEDWLNDGPPLAARVAMETIGGWFGDNNTALGRWVIDGQVIDPAKVDCPAFAAIPANDRIVPPGSAMPLADRLRNVTVLEPRAGHIGMVVSGKAEGELWRPLNDWLATLR